MSSATRYKSLREPDHAAAVGSARISAAWHLPEVLRELGVDPDDVLDAAGVSPSVFADRDTRIAYPDFARLLLESERLSGCDHIVCLVAQRSRLVDFGLAGRAALCSDTVGVALRRLVDTFALHNTAAILDVVTSGAYARLVYSIVEPQVPDARPFQLGSMTLAVGILRELCGREFQPTVVTFASRAPSDLRPVRKYFRAPLRFDSTESAVVFERRWLDRPLPPVDARVREQVDAELRAQRELALLELPATVRRILRRQLMVGDCSMDRVAAMLGMHRRTLDRQLGRHGIGYSGLVAAEKSDVARRLLRETDTPIEQIAASLKFSSAANFTTAFRRWTGVTPGAFRRGAD